MSAVFLQSPDIERVQYDIEIPAIVSFPRSGSHWLYSMMEDYFEKSVINVSFFGSPKWNLCEVHDLHLNIRKKEAMVLYRKDVASVIFSVMYKRNELENFGYPFFLRYVYIYGAHMNKWLFEEDFTEKKISFSYEDMKTDLDSVFKKICWFMKENYDRKKLESTRKKFSDKSSIRKLEIPDKGVIDKLLDDSNYEEKRMEFKDKYLEEILDRLGDYGYKKVLDIIGA